MATIAELEAQVDKLQKQISEAKKAQGLSPWGLTEIGERGFYVALSNNSIQKDCFRGECEDTTTFQSKKIAEGFLNVWTVMVMLRQQPGAGVIDEDNDGWAWVFDPYSDEIEKDAHPCCSLFPPFPSEKLAEQALNAVGKARIVAAFEFLESGVCKPPEFL